MTQRPIRWLPLSLIMAWLAVGCGSSADRSRSTTPESPASPTVPAPPNEAALQPCRIDDAQGCGAKPKSGNEGKPPPLDPSQRYHVPIASDDPRLGPRTARVQLVVFSDYQCPYCKYLKPTLQRLRDEYESDLSIIWKDMPLPMHPFAKAAARLGRAAYAQGGDAKFWEANDLLYERQDELSEETLVEIARELDLKWPQAEQYDAHLARDWDLSLELNIDSTPTTFVNGRPITGAKDYEEFERVVKEELRR
jgi:protein-disulfide isomerase